MYPITTERIPTLGITFLTMSMKITRLLTISCGLALATIVTAWGQNSNAPSSIGDTYYISDVWVHSRPGVAPRIQDVIVAKSIIRAAAPNLSPPFDARIVRGDSMHLYPGFIAALTHEGLAREEDQEKEDLRDPGNPSYEQAGITPHRLSSDMLGPNKSVEGLRKAGFTIAHVAPDGRMLPGQTTLISTIDADKASVRILSSNQHHYARLRGARGRIYPSTVIAVMSKMRELHMNAALAKEYTLRYQQNPLGLAAPRYDDVIESLIPVTTGQQSIYYRADKVKDIYRVLQLQKELGFHLVLAETKEAYHVVDKLKQSGSTVLISLDLPDKPEDIDSTDSELLDWHTRKMQAYDDALRQAQLLKKSGVPYAFSLVGTKASKVHEQVQRMVDSGLDVEDALAALTTAPARLLGIDKMAGTITKGKMANLILTDEPLWSEKWSIKHTWVAGQYHKASADKKDDEAANGLQIEGTWSFSVDVMGDEQTGKMIIKSVDGDYEVTLISDDDPDDPYTVSDGRVDGKTMTFPYSIDQDGYTVNMVFKLDFDEDDYKGTIDIEGVGNFNIEGSKISDPEK